MKNIIVTLFILGSLSAQADQGSFNISNTSFKNLFNNYRIGGPAVAPWVGSWWAYKNNGIDYATPPDPRSTAVVESPAAKFDKFHGIAGNKTATWEEKNHTCDNQEGESKKSCEGWWGHCNAWAAAAIKEVEPRKSFSKKGQKFTVADQKAYLSELYMETYSEFVGNTDKGTKTSMDWIFDRDHKDAKKIIGRRGINVYDAFWDVSPKAFFLILTNYLGQQKVGIIIDRFTGDQVWNQPLAGYRILPITEDNIKPAEKKYGKTVYPVLVRTNMYWAEDGVWEHEVSDPFDYEKDTNDNFYLGDFEVNHHYKGRSLAFYLYFDKPVKVTRDGKTVKSAGRIVGDGVWFHQTELGKEVYTKNKVDFDNTHPDFIWFPTKVNDESRRTYRNPQINSERVAAIMKTEEEPTPAPPVGDQNFTCKYELRGFFGNSRGFFSGESSVSQQEACNKAASQCDQKRRGWQNCRIR